MTALKPCPFCAAELRIRAGFNSYGHCPTDGCYANRGQIVPLDDERQVAAWNRRPALSPEAPAREGGDLEGLLTTALTDELQDGGAEVPYSIIAERVAARVADEASAPSCLTPCHEAPAEGAGERTKGAAELQAELDQLANEYGDLLAEVEALRARSSAPEAREGEAVGVVYSLKADLNTAELPDGTLLYTRPAHPSADHAELTRLAEAAGEEALGNLLAVIHGDGGHRALEVGTKQAALEAEKIVANLLSSAPEAREDQS